HTSFSRDWSSDVCSSDLPRSFSPRRRRESGSLRSRRAARRAAPGARRNDALGEGSAAAATHAGERSPALRAPQARKDLSDDRRLTEPRQETPRSPRARQALTRPKETLL